MRLELESNILDTMGGIVAGAEHTACGRQVCWLFIAAISGLAHEYSELDEWINKNVFLTAWLSLRKLTICEICSHLKTFKNAKWDYFFKTGDDTFLNDPVVSKITKDLKMQELSETRQALFFYNSKNDETIPAADADDFWWPMFCVSVVSC